MGVTLGLQLLDIPDFKRNVPAVLHLQTQVVSIVREELPFIQATDSFHCFLYISESSNDKNCCVSYFSLSKIEHVSMATTLPLASCPN